MNKKNEITVIPKLKEFIKKDKIIARYQEFFKDGSMFLEGVLGAVVQSKKLQDCSLESIMNAAMESAKLGLPVNSQLGYGYLVPYKGEASYQIGYKGLLQLAIDTGEYLSIIGTPVYNDEFIKYNPFTGELLYTVHEGHDCDRYNNGEIVGYYVKFTLKNGFSAELYASEKNLLEFAEKHSEAYKYDLRKGYKYSPWSTNKTSMCIKTLFKRLIKTFGIMSPRLMMALSSVDVPTDEVEPEIIKPLGEEVKQDYKGNCPI